ncbi:hypothetical protein N0V82_005358 [Gnomoniopsis sp. IMI 355080]|nr:hypothetical protein N0V82_005358 [Gnomoniopsis sp. IMI 355080]
MEVVEILGDLDDHEGAQVTFRLENSGERIVISLFRSIQTEAPDELIGSLPLVDQIIRLLGRSLMTDNYDEQQELEDKALDPIYQAAETIILKAQDTANISAHSNHTSTLHNILYPKTSYYRLQSTGPGIGLTLVPVGADEAYAISFDDGQALLDHSSVVKADNSLPRYSTHQVHVVEEYSSGGGTVCLATVVGQDQKFLCKARRDGLRNPSLEREMDCLHRISRALEGVASHTAALRVPALKGYVEHPDTGVILGLLRDWVPSHHSLRDLEDAESCGLDARRDLREKWAGQIQATVRTLHSVDVVWGDAKPSNVVIDLNNDAWLIDFGGGWTDGWVDENLQETMEGDEQGVARLLEFLDVDS